MKKILQISDSPFPMCYSNDAVINSILTNSALLDENVAIISDIKYNGQKIDMEDKSFKGIVQKISEIIIIFMPINFQTK